jgi:RNA polymerase-associated protein
MPARRARAGRQPVKPAANAGLTLYAAPDEVESDWVRLVLAEKEVEGARVRMLAPGRFDEDLAVLNPSQALPTLADREGVFVGAWIIAEYLDERYPHPRLTPTAPAERAQLRMALQHIERDLFPLCRDERRGEGRGGGAGAAALQKAVIDALENGVRLFGAKGWFLGFDYSLADCAWAVLLRRLTPSALSTRPALAQYAQRLYSRTAFRGCFGEKPQ